MDLLEITEIAKKAGIPAKYVEPYGHTKAKIDMALYDEIKKNTRHYVKRQDTFFAHQFEIEWVDGLEDILKRLEQ